jgi:hypothetical protein
MGTMAFGGDIKSGRNVTQEDKLAEIISCGYAFYTDVNGVDYLCYGEVNKLEFLEKTSCRKVKAEFDNYTKRPNKIYYINDITKN